MVNIYEFDGYDHCAVCIFESMTDEWLDFIINCRRGIRHDYDIVEGPMADDQIWNYIEDVVAGNVTKRHFGSLRNSNIPTPLDMGKVYARLILQTRLDAEDYAQGIIRVYNNDLCETIDNYNCSAYYEPSYFIARSYFAGGLL